MNMYLNASCRTSWLNPPLSVDIVLLCPALCLDWHRQPSCYPVNCFTCHTCLHTSSHCCGPSATPCEVVAKTRLDNSFSVAKLVTREVGEVRCCLTGSGGLLVICKQVKINI